MPYGQDDDSLMSSAHALLRQCEAVKKDARHAMRISGVTAEQLEIAKNNATTSPVFRQLKQSSRLDAILSTVTAEVEQQAREIELSAQSAGLKKKWGRGSSHFEGARSLARSQMPSPGGMSIAKRQKRHHSSPHYCQLHL